MKDEYTIDDVKGAIKNPFYEKLNTEITIAVRKDIYQIFSDIGKKNGVEPEIIMNRCLTNYAKQLKTHDD